MRVLIRAAGILGPGLRDWNSSLPVLRGQTPYRPEPVQLSPVEALPPAERRRTGPPIRLALSTGLQALASSGLSAADVVTVFASSGGDGQVIHEICEALATEQREVSPTRFHNSVHNAAAGYWGIATGSREPSTSLCCYDASFAAGLLEAAAQVTADRTAVALIAYDQHYPQPLHAVRRLGDAFAVALVLVPQRTDRTFAILDVRLVPTNERPTRMTSASLEAVRVSVPAGRSLPVLAALARGAAETAIFEYVGASRLQIKVEPC